MVVGELAFVKNLQQEVVYRLVRLLDFIKENHLMGVLDKRFGQCPRLLVSDIASSGADELGHAVFLLIFGHVELRESDSEFLRKRLGEFGLTTIMGNEVIGKISMFNTVYPQVVYMHFSKILNCINRFYGILFAKLIPNGQFSCLNPISFFIKKKMVIRAF